MGSPIVEDGDERLERGSVVISEVRPLYNGGRRPGDNNIGPTLRELIGTAAQFDTAKDVAKAFNVSPQQVHNLKHGKTTHDIPDPELKNRIMNRKEEVADLALTKIVESINALTEDKFINAKGRELAGMARDLSTVVRTALPQEVGPQVAQVVIYAPQQNNMTKYEIVEAPPDAD